MSDTSVLTVQVRNQTGTRAAKRLRAEGQIPAVIYGHKQDPLWLSVSDEQIQYLLRHGAHHLLELDIDGRKQSAVIKDMQFDVFGREVLHVDFARVDKDEVVTLEVGIVLKGAPAGGTAGGLLQQQMHNLEIQCPAYNIQEEIIVNVAGLKIGDALLVKDLVLPAGIKATQDPDQIVVQMVEATHTEEEPGMSEPSAAEPEVIRREAKEEGADE